MKKCNSDSHGQETSSRYLFAADEQSTNQWSEERARKAGKRKLWYQYLAKENPKWTLSSRNATLHNPRSALSSWHILPQARLNRKETKECKQFSKMHYYAL